MHYNISFKSRTCDNWPLGEIFGGAAAASEMESISVSSKGDEPAVNHCGSFGEFTGAVLNSNKAVMI